ncbi:sulfotransferase family protein [Stieleria sp. JC731]|uniref:sulfotransferase family protein n=1 Tax=Stieleria sp. JC731 TaxID=2894195 RepID=UPI0021BC7282|nr:sulfotransferase [Stieleria sp. JC731]
MPGFIICGAMKCGTSTVHALLEKHPAVFVPKDEVNFFDIDDIFQHSDFFINGSERWHVPNILDGSTRYWEWYQRFFQEAPSDAILGEDSTCYLASPRAFKRIGMQEQPIKLVVCLRQPTQRAYSQYWHMLRTGRAMFTFEDTLRFIPSMVLARSMYLEQVRRMLEFIPRERVFFFVLEEFVSDKAGIAKGLSDFLGIDYSLFPSDALQTHTNKAKFPRSVRLQALKNRMLRSAGNQQYVGRLPYSVDIGSRQMPLAARAIEWVHNRINPSRMGATPKMEASTKEFLDDFFRRELDGLSELVGKDLEKYWY